MNYDHDEPLFMIKWLLHRTSAGLVALLKSLFAEEAEVIFLGH